MNETTRGTRLPRALRPFASGQYRLLAGALVFSMLSVGIWLVASVWQVIALGGSPTDLSLVAAGASLGLVLSVLIGGAAADRIPQRFIMLTVGSGARHRVCGRCRPVADRVWCRSGSSPQLPSYSGSPTASSIPPTRRGCRR